MLLAQLEYSEWVLRRVEKVEFERDRSVSRRIAIELKVRTDAPVFVDADGEEFWLVPLSSMRRRTLVNLALRSENDEAITLPGIRLTQQLDQAMLLAAAAAQPIAWSGRACCPRVHPAIRGRDLRPGDRGHR